MTFGGAVRYNTAPAMLTTPSERTYLEALAAFAQDLRPDADAMDSRADVLGTWYDRFQAQGLNAGWAPRQPLSGRGFCEALATLSRESGAFAFVALQQIVANGIIGGKRFDDAAATAPWPKVGVAFGHLRSPDGPAPILVAGRASGPVPWLTGAGLFEKVVLGLRTSNGEEVLALVDGHDRPAFRHGPPLPLAACAGTRTVRVTIENLAVGDADVLAVRPRGAMQRSDAGGVLFQTPLLVGCVEACRDLVRASPRVPDDQKAHCEAATDALLGRVRDAFDRDAAEEGQRLRAQLGDFTVRLARLSVMACGGGALAVGHPAQRLYREALLYSLMAQTDAIVGQAFEEVFR